MLNLNKRLIQREEADKSIRVGVVGAGQMGKGLVSQVSLMRGMNISIVSDHTMQKAVDTFLLAGIKRDDIACVTSADEATYALERGKFVACEDYEIINKCGLIDACVDATGNNDAGALIAQGAINNNQHIVMLNVEADVTAGVELKRLADRQGVIYTGSAGDEPGAVKELYDFADALGLETLVIGKGKNNKVNLEANPDSAYDEAVRKGLAPKMLASFQDGTKTMVEMTCMSNATGFLPDVRGANGIKCNTTNICDLLRLKSEGGVLNSYKTVEYVDGLAPGVFIIITTNLSQIHHEIQYLKVGSGPNYLLYRPYHLCSLETPITVARAVIYNEPTIVSEFGKPISETITIAKRDLKKGEYLDYIGGYTVYGSFEKYEVAREENLVPIGLVNKKTRVNTDLKKGTAIKMSDLVFDESSPMFKLRKEQDEQLSRKL